MQIEMEFAYQIEITAPSVRRPGDHVLPKLHWLFGRETVDFRELDPEEFPVAIRRPYRSARPDYVERTDGEQLFHESHPDIATLRNRWSTAYSRNDGACFLRSWFGDGKTASMDWCPTFEEDFPKPPEGSLFWSGREDARQQLHQGIANCVVVDGKLWRGGSLPIIAVLSPGSSRPGWGPAARTGVPRVLEMTDRYGTDRDYMAELAARDLLFYPDERQQARDRALDFGKRIIDIDREWVIERLPPYQDFSVLSMTSWARLLVKHLVHDEMPAEPVMVVPAREDEFTYQLMRPAELVEPIETLLKIAKADSPRREMMSAFSAIKAAFGATIETSRMARRRDIAELLEVHDRILRRVDMRPDRRMAQALTDIDEDALGRLVEDDGQRTPGL